MAKKQNFMVQLKGGIRVFVDGVSPNKDFVSFRIVGTRGGGLYNNVLTKDDLGKLRTLFELAQMASEVPQPPLPGPERW